jgi:hypothetical protein
MLKSRCIPGIGAPGVCWCKSPKVTAKRHGAGRYLLQRCSLMLGPTNGQLRRMALLALQIKWVPERTGGLLAYYLKQLGTKRHGSKAGVPSPTSLWNNSMHSEPPETACIAALHDLKLS